jgi:hypothetical protein
MSGINWEAALVAALAGYALGLLWYSPWGFLHVWIRAAQIQKPPTPTPQMFLLLFVLQLVAASGFALLLASVWWRRASASTTRSRIARGGIGSSTRAIMSCAS